MSALPSQSPVVHKADVAIADRRSFDRRALRLLCAADPGLSVVQEVHDLDELRARPQCGGTAVVLIGRSMVRGWTAGGIQALRRRLGKVRLVLVGSSEEPLLQLEVSRLGLDGYLARDGDAAGQLAAITGGDAAAPPLHAVS